MKRFLVFCVASFLVLSANAQIIRAQPFARAQSAGSSYCAEYQAVLNAMTTDPSDANKGYQNTMVQALVTPGYFARMKLFLVFATEVNTAGEALIWWNSPATSADNVHAVPWATQAGYTGGAASDYISSNFNPTTAGVNQNSVTIGVYSRTELNGDYCAAGLTYTNSLFIFPRNAGYLISKLNHAASNFSRSNASSLGLCVSTRRASNDVESYLNGASLTSSASYASVGVPDGEMYVLANNNAGTRASAYAGEISIVFIMDGTTDAENTAINTIFETYMDAIGTGVEP